MKNMEGGSVACVTREDRRTGNQGWIPDVAKGHASFRRTLRGRGAKQACFATENVA